MEQFCGEWGRMSRFDDLVFGCINQGFFLVGEVSKQYEDHVVTLATDGLYNTVCERLPANLGMGVGFMGPVHNKSHMNTF